MVKYGGGMPPKEAQGPTSDTVDAGQDAGYVDVGQFSDGRWPLAATMYADFLELDTQLLNTFEMWKALYGAVQAIVSEEREAKRVLDATEARIDNAITDEQVAAKSKPEREAKRKSLIVADDRYQDALKMLNAVKARSDTLNRELDEAAKALQVAERRFRWRERWLGFMSTVPSRAANFTPPEVERIKGSQAEGASEPPSGFIEKEDVPF